VLASRAARRDAVEPQQRRGHRGGRGGSGTDGGGLR
jgi:hypothetical protein